MAIRKTTERTEAIERFASSRVFFLVLSVLSALICLLGSPIRGAAAAQSALGSMDVARLGLAEDLPVEVEEDRGLYYRVYRVAKGDTLSGIAETYGVTLDTRVSFNAIQNARSLQPGQLLKVPSMAGILYAPKDGDTVEAVALANKISADRVIEANGLMSGILQAGKPLFLPDARLASFKLREISGDLFRWPVRGWITSWFGYRNDPFSGSRTFHNGLDIGADMDTSVAAGMEGTVAAIGYTSGSGNYVLISHHSGWSSFYGHLNAVLVKPGQRVVTGTRIAWSGNTGYSTGPHLHFSVFKNGRSVNPANVLH
jgi:murein DD-endopeptidase MepM/ murein hydrolase activator NlpD